MKEDRDLIFLDDVYFYQQWRYPAELPLVMDLFSSSSAILSYSAISKSIPIHLYREKINKVDKIIMHCPNFQFLLSCHVSCKTTTTMSHVALAYIILQFIGFAFYKVTRMFFTFMLWTYYLLLVLIPKHLVQRTKSSGRKTNTILYMTFSLRSHIKR